MGNFTLILILFHSSILYMPISTVDSFNSSAELEESIMRIEKLLEGTKEDVEQKILREFYSIPYHEDSAKYGARYGYSLKNIPDGLQLTTYDRKTIDIKKFCHMKIKE